MVVTSRWHIAVQEKNPARLDRGGQRDADGVQGDSGPYEGLLRSAEFHPQALDGPRKGFLPQKPFDSGMQLFKITQVHWPLASAAERTSSAARPAEDRPHGTRNRRGGPGPLQRLVRRAFSTGAATDAIP